MAIPNDLESLVRSAAESRRRKLAAERDARRSEHLDLRQQEARERAAKERAPEAARVVWAWLAGEEGERLRELLRTHRLRDVRLFGPVWAHSGEPADGLRSGTQVLHLVEDEVAVRLLWRIAPMAGADEVVRSETRLCELLQPLPLVRLAEAVRTGDLWTGLRAELLGA